MTIEESLSRIATALEVIAKDGIQLDLTGINQMSTSIDGVMNELQKTRLQL